MTSIRAAVVTSSGTAPEMCDLTMASPGFDEVRVRVVSTGVCHTDVAWADGALWDRYPVVLGHETSGIVEGVGPAVTRIAPGDRVVLALAHHCGHCGYCESGRPMLCAQRVEEPPRLLLDGVPVIQGFGSGGFAEAVLVREASVIRVPSAVPLDVAAVLGCATSTGLGSVFNIAHVEYGTRVLILGAGGIGLNVLMGCRIAGAERIVVADPSEQRREQALRFGATDVASPDEDHLRELVPDGFEFVFESAGVVSAMELAVRMTSRGGTCTLIGAPPSGEEFRINALDFVPSQRRILGCLTGNVRPNVDFDRYFRLYERGLLDLDALVTGVVGLDDLAAGFDRCRRSDGIRTIVRVTDE